MNSNNRYMRRVDYGNSFKEPKVKVNKRHSIKKMFLRHKKKLLQEKIEEELREIENKKRIKKPPKKKKKDPNDFQITFVKSPRRKPVKNYVKENRKICSFTSLRKTPKKEPNIYQITRKKYENISSKYMDYVMEHKRLIELCCSPKHLTLKKLQRRKDDLKMKSFKRKLFEDDEEFKTPPKKNIMRKSFTSVNQVSTPFKRISPSLDRVKMRVLTPVRKLAEQKKKRRFQLIQQEVAISRRRNSEPPRGVQEVRKKIAEKEKAVTHGEKRLTEKQKQILLEFYETEKTYVKGLKLMKEKFEIPMKEILEKKDYFNLFNYIEIVRNVNSYFLDKLEELSIFQPNCEKFDEKCLKSFLDIFLQISPSFKLYETFISHFNVSLTTLETIETHQRVKKLLTEKTMEMVQEGRTTCRLPEYLILPIQRLPRYIILLDRLLKKTEREGNEEIYQKVVDCSNIVSDITKYCDEKNKEFENYSKLKVYSKEFKLENNPSRKFILDGEYFSSPGSENKVKWFYFFSDILISKESGLLGYSKKKYKLKIPETHGVEFGEQNLVEIIRNDDQETEIKLYCKAEKKYKILKEHFGK